MAKKPARIDKRISVILLESNKHLWEKYEVVKVKAIFAKNVLFAKGLAVLADKDALYGFRAKMEAANKNKEKKSESYSSIFEKIANDNGLIFVMKANEKWVLYEKIDPTHITNQIKTVYGIQVEDHLFKMKKKITQVGEYTIPFQYNTIEKDMLIVVKAEDAKATKKEEIVEEIVSE